MKSYREATIKCENHQWRVVSVSSKRNVYTEELIDMIEMDAVRELEARVKELEGERDDYKEVLRLISVMFLDHPEDAIIMQEWSRDILAKHKKQEE